MTTPFATFNSAVSHTPLGKLHGIELTSIVKIDDDAEISEIYVLAEAPSGATWRLFKQHKIDIERQVGTTHYVVLDKDWELVGEGKTLSDTVWMLQQADAHMRVLDNTELAMAEAHQASNGDHHD